MYSVEEKEYIIAVFDGSSRTGFFPENYIQTSPHQKKTEENGRIEFLVPKDV